MRRLVAWSRRLVGTFRAARADREFQAELESHLALHEDDNLRAGMAPDEARRQAVLKLGGIEATRESVRERRGLPRLESLGQDLRYALRVLRRNPAFTAVGVATLALGIGANAALFSVLDAVLLRPLPFAAPQRLVRVDSLIDRTTEVGGVCYPDFEDWRAQNRVFSQVAVYAARGFTLAGSGEALRLRGAAASSELFALLGVEPLLGRGFVAADERPGAVNGTDVLVLGHGLWRRQFGGDPAIVGRTVELDHRPFTIVGVMPAGFQFPIETEPIELWTTLAVDGHTASPDEQPMTAQRGVHYLQAIARLKPGVALAAAQAEMEAIVARLNREYPDDARGVRLGAEHARLVGDVRTGLLVLMGAVGCVLLVACANLAGLLLSRAVARQREVAVRAALGAGRGRIAQQLLVETALLAGAGGLCGLVLAQWSIPLLLRLVPRTVPRLAESHLDGHVLLFAGALSALTAVALGLVPLIPLSRLDLVQAVKQGGRGAGPGAGPSRLQNALVVGQMAVAVMLLSAAGLFVQSLLRLARVERGFDAEQVLSFRIDVPDAYSIARERALYDQLLARLRAQPGVRAASLVLSLPLAAGSQFDVTYDVEERPLEEAERPRAGFNAVDPGYFGTLGIAVASGRDFDAHDDLRGQAVCVISEALARREFPGADPLGKRIRPGVGNGYAETPQRTIVGVVRDVRGQSLRNAPAPVVYVPLAQCPRLGGVSVALRAAGDPAEL
ncbi:MAG TPA: ABC transporter permease, partial [Candidatus Polarisedimenticolaceae bacterium]|nr:ABC transporter permease [Candidatus Polarisedimenticolaceae bacterium]